MPKHLLGPALLSLALSARLDAQLPLRLAPVCLRLTYDSLDRRGIQPGDVPALLKLERGRRSGSVRPLDPAFINLRLDRGQEWDVRMRPDSTFDYTVTLAGHGTMIAYVITVRHDTITGNVAILYVDKVRRAAEQRRTDLTAVVEPCPGQD